MTYTMERILSELLKQYVDCGSEREREDRMLCVLKLTCREFWFSILVLTSGWSVKSGAKYSKYSGRGEERKLAKGKKQWQKSLGLLAYRYREAHH